MYIFIVMKRTMQLIFGLPHLFHVCHCPVSGADAILIHSKKSEPDDIVEFMKRWNNDVRMILLIG